MSKAKPIQFYDFKSSPNCQRVRIVLEEKKLPFETIPVDLRKKEQKRPEFLQLNPYGKVPVIIDGDTVLYESCVINEYLDEKYPEPPLMPKDHARRAKIRILIDYGLGHLDSPYQKLRQEAMKGEKDQNPEVIETARAELRTLLKPLEEEIGGHEYLSGEFSLLDAALVPRFLRLEGMKVIPHPSLPRLDKWLQRMKERPSVRAIL